MGGLFMLIGLLFMLGVVYPVCGVIACKLSGSKKTISEILDEL